MNRKLIVFAMLALNINGCASLAREIHKEVRIGDSQAYVEDLLGAPDSFQQDNMDSNTVVWGYKRRDDMCAIAFQDAKVTEVACQKDPKYKSAMALFAKGFSEGYNEVKDQKQQVKTLNCYTTGWGNAAYVTCY